MNRFVYLNYATRGHIIQKPLKTEDKNGWGRLKLQRLRVRDAWECVFYSVHRIVLKKRFDVRYLDISPDIGVGGTERNGPGCQVGVTANPQRCCRVGSARARSSGTSHRICTSGATRLTATLPHLAVDRPIYAGTDQ